MHANQINLVTLASDPLQTRERRVVWKTRRRMAPRRRCPEPKSKLRLQHLAGIRGKKAPVKGEAVFEQATALGWTFVELGARWLGR
jgi:hypothetical protein